MIAGISGFGFFGSKNGCFVTHMFFFKKCSAETRVYSVLGVHAFLAKLSKKGEILDPQNKNRQFCLITEKAHVLVFWAVLAFKFFLVSLSFSFF